MISSIFSAFVGPRLVAQGLRDDVFAAARPYSDNKAGPLLLFDHGTGSQIDFDWSQPAPPPAKVGPGRPRLGVVSTEVTLLPRHWEWLAAQPAKASGTLRRLVEEAMAQEALDPRRRLTALGKILWAVAGNEPDFEDASRALYAGDRTRLAELSACWAGDLPGFVRSWV